MVFYGDFSQQFNWFQSLRLFVQYKFMLISPHCDKLLPGVLRQLIELASIKSHIWFYDTDQSESAIPHKYRLFDTRKAVQGGLQRSCLRHHLIQILRDLQTQTKDRNCIINFIPLNLIDFKFSFITFMPTFHTKYISVQLVLFT